MSVHAPSRFSKLPEQKVAELLSQCIDHKMHVVLHPDAIQDPGCWLHFGKWLCIENMDNRKPTGRTANELNPFFDLFPDAGFCFDIAHARQVDGTMTEALELLRRFGDRLVQIHLSEVDAGGRHHRLSASAARAVRRVIRLLPADAPVILEAMVAPEDIDAEVAAAKRAFQQRAPGTLERELLFSAID